jgi:hypothetical protein
LMDLLGYLQVVLVALMISSFVWLFDIDSLLVHQRG